MVDLLASFVVEMYIRVSTVFENLTGATAPSVSDPIIFIVHVIAYIFLLVVIIRLVIAVVRWFYRI